MVAAARPRSFEELYRLIQDLPEGQRGEILVAGQLHVTMGRPGKKHRRAAQVLHVALAPFDANVGGTGWWIELEPEVRFGDRLFDPDLAGWRIDRVPELPEENPITVTPDWCCEVLSPSTAKDDVRTKLPGYIAAGVPYVWIVEPSLTSSRSSPARAASRPSSRPLRTSRRRVYRRSTSRWTCGGCGSDRRCEGGPKWGERGAPPVPKAPPVSLSFTSRRPRAHALTP
jgi:Uma2 family endonuclease